MAGHDRITPEGRRFSAQIKELKKLQVRVGYQAGETEEGGVDMLDIAMWNELGTSRSPARPFIRESADRNKSVIERFCKAKLRAIAKGGTAEETLNAVGAAQKGLIQDTISKSKSWAQENSQMTIDQKGSDQPLVDTGRLAQSASYVIIPKGGG